MLEEDSYLGLAYDPTNMSVMWSTGTLGAKPLVKMQLFYLFDLAAECQACVSMADILEFS